VGDAAVFQAEKRVLRRMAVFAACSLRGAARPSGAAARVFRDAKPWRGLGAIIIIDGTATTPFSTRCS